MISKEYNNIFKSWKDNVSSSDIYHMILYWINTYKDEITDSYVLELLEDVLYRMNNDDETNDIVEDFIYGSKYESIRKYFN